MSNPEQNIRSICILRLSSIGDITHVIPVVLSLQQQLPNAHLTWIIGKTEARLIGDLPGVEYIIFDKKLPIRSFLMLKQQLKRRHFDVLLHLQTSGRANLCSTFISADLKIGFDKARSREFQQLFTNKSIKAESKQHICDDLSSFLLALDLQKTKPTWSIPLSDKDRAFAHQHIDPNRLNIIFSPCSSHTLRNWLPERYAELADYAITNYDAKIIFVGSNCFFEKNFVSEIQSHMTQPMLNLVGNDTLKQLAALLAEADLLISPDTGPAHIANAMGTDVIGLYAASNPYRTGPYNSLEWCVNRYPEALLKYLGKTVETCRWGTKLERREVMSLITVDEVKEMLNRYFKARNIQQAHIAGKAMFSIK